MKKKIDNRAGEKKQKSKRILKKKTSKVVIVDKENNTKENNVKENTSFINWTSLISEDPGLI